MMWRPQYTVGVMVITGGQSSNKVEPSSVIVMLLSAYTHLTMISGDFVWGMAAQWIERQTDNHNIGGSNPTSSSSKLGQFR